MGRERTGGTVPCRGEGGLGAENGVIEDVPWTEEYLKKVAEVKVKVCSDPNGQLITEDSEEAKNKNLLKHRYCSPNGQLITEEEAKERHRKKKAEKKEDAEDALKSF